MDDLDFIVCLECGKRADGRDAARAREAQRRSRAEKKAAADKK